MLQYWFMFPVGIIIATIAMMAGIGGAILFSPIFMLILKLDPITAVSAGLLMEVFGFTSGVIGYFKKKSIDFKLVQKLIILTLPATILGVILGKFISGLFIKYILIVILIYLALSFLINRKCQAKHPSCTGISKPNKESKVDKSIRISSFFGGLLVGISSSGLGEINEYNFLKKLKLPVPIASGTSVFLVAMSATIGIITHLFFLISNKEFNIFAKVLPIVIFTIPGVILGAQLGVYLSKNIKIKFMEKFVGILFFIVGILMIITLVF